LFPSAGAEYSEQKMRSVFMFRVIFDTPPSQVFSLRMPGEKVHHFLLLFI